MKNKLKGLNAWDMQKALLEENKKILKLLVHLRRSKHLRIKKEPIVLDKPFKTNAGRKTFFKSYKIVSQDPRDYKQKPIEKMEVGDFVQMTWNNGQNSKTMTRYKFYAVGKIVFQVRGKRKALVKRFGFRNDSLIIKYYNVNNYYNFTCFESK